MDKIYEKLEEILNAMNDLKELLDIKRGSLKLLKPLMRAGRWMQHSGVAIFFDKTRTCQQWTRYKSPTIRID